MLRIWCFIVFLFSISDCIISENLSHIDSLSIQMSDEKASSIDELVAYCENHAVSDLARVRFYFVWIATHVSYDDGVFENDKQSPVFVFKYKKAVCSGYSRLLEHLCEQSGIATRYVSGYGKDADDTGDIENHAWNVVRIDGKWYPFDVTWAANSLSDDMDNPLSFDFDEWFMACPEVFQKTHLPFDPTFQLSQKWVNRAHFLGETPKISEYTEGGDVSTKPFNFEDILNEEIALDSIEKIWRSYRRAYDFMPLDSAVAIKLAKAQEGKVKRIFEYVYQFRNRDYPNVAQTATDLLKTWISSLKKLEKPMEDALNLHRELDVLPLSEVNKQMQKHNFSFFKGLQDFTKKAIEELNIEISSRE